MSDHGIALSETGPPETPCRKVLGTTELLEHILSFLPGRKLFVCRGLSSNFKGVIDGSHLLKEAMFLRPTRAPRQAWRLDPNADGSGKRITGVRPVAGMVPLPGKETGHLQPFGAASHTIRTPAALNPIFSMAIERARDSQEYFGHITTDEILHHIKTGHLDRQDSILDMYLTQPPCRQAWVIASLVLPSNSSNVNHLLCKGLLELDTGITIRDLLKTASTLRGVVEVYRKRPRAPRKKKRWSYTNWEPRKYKKKSPLPPLAPELFPEATMIEVLRLLDIDGVSVNPNEVEVGASCWFSDTIIATDEMWASVASYMEDTT